MKERLRKIAKFCREKPEEIFKYYNLFSWIVFSRLSMDLVDMYKYSIHCAEKDGHSGSWYDVFDGIMWICSFVAFTIVWGYVFN